MEIRACRRQHFYDRICKHQYENGDVDTEFDEEIYEEQMYFEDLNSKI